MAVSEVDKGLANRLEHLFLPEAGSSRPHLLIIGSIRPDVNGLRTRPRRFLYSLSVIDAAAETTTLDRRPPPPRTDEGSDHDRTSSRRSFRALAPSAMAASRA